VIEGTEVAPGVWVLRNGGSGRNMGVVLRENSGEATLVNPGDLQVEQDALESFVAEMRSRVAGLLFTDEPEYSDMVMWPNAAFVTPTTGTEFSLVAMVPGWEVLTLSQGAYLALYSGKDRTLFCGNMLRRDLLPELNNGTQSYLDALDKVETLDARLVWPAFGPEARGKREIKARIEHDRSYIMSVLRHVATSRAARLPLERVVEVASQIYEDYPNLETHLRNIRYAWEEGSS
jgi:hypothetical protein